VPEVVTLGVAPDGIVNAVVALEPPPPNPQPTARRVTEIRRIATASCLIRLDILFPS
jgi:hypothetical protein